MNFTVLDLNVWHGLYARTLWKIERLEPPEGREKRLEALIASVRELAPDVIALQECFPQPAFGRRIAAELGYDHVSRVSNAGLRMFGFGFPAGVKTGEGSTILARPGLGLKPLGGRDLSGFGWTHGILSLQPVPKRCALGGEVTIGDKRVRIVTAHLRYEFATERELGMAWTDLAAAGQVTGGLPTSVIEAVRSSIATRDQEIASLSQWLEELSKEAPVVLAADMNLDDEAPQLRAFAEKLSLTSALALTGDTRPTWDPVRNPNVEKSSSYVYVDGRMKDVPSLVVAQHDRMAQRPDHIFLDPKFARADLIDARIVCDQPRDGFVPSDHFGILATLQI